MLIRTIEVLTHIQPKNNSLSHHLKIFSQTLAAQRVGRCNTLEDSFSLMTVLDHVEPLTLDLVFNLHEVAENCNTEAPLHADTKRSIAVYNNADRMIKIVTTFVGRNEGRNRLTFVDQLEPIHFTPSTFSLSTQSCQSMPVSISTCSPPSSDAYLKYTLLRSPTDSLLGITDANRTYLQESTDSHEGENPYVLRLDNFICTLHWWLFKVEAAQKVLNYTTTDLINVW
jgi:hypothetical protein